ncbi:cell division protein FtsK [Jiangella anatolica]|uniref:Cell division protein FtsK n=2 Tax=Jiangella anatolica TaxID=2670374 RepID=A0A2W2BIT1_9ACTN|nr:cell division protein FtsK [Jiangella anatolica]
MALLLIAWPLVLVWKFPILVAALVVAAGAVYAASYLVADWTLVAAATVAPVVLLAAWRTAHRSSFAPVGAWLLGCVRCGLLYRWRWRHHAIACGLGMRDKDGEVITPRLVRVLSKPGRDELKVRMLPGQTPDLYLTRVVPLAHAFRIASSHPEYIDRVTATCTKSGMVTITFPRADPLRHYVPPFRHPPAERLDLSALPVARLDSTMDAYRLPLLYTHVLVAGATGSGKGSVLWSIVNALAPGIPVGLVRLYGIDPKGGMELALGRSLFHRLAYDTGDDRTGEERAADLVRVMEDLADVSAARAARYAGKLRKFAPSPDEPYIVLVIDELAYLTKYMPFPALKKTFSQAMATVLTQGRAVGVTIVGLLQDPRKETVPERSLFPVKIGLRLDSASESRMILGDAGYERGGHCEAIPTGLPGVGYVLIDGDPTPRRVRFSYLSDDDVRALAWTNPTPPPAPPAAALVAVPDNDDRAAVAA